METELEPRVKPLPFKVKAMSRESSSQKAAQVLEPDLRSHWSTGTNTKEWILLELSEPSLLSRVRIYNKSVLEWEISVGLQYKPEAFVKVRPRCEAPRRDMIYPVNYTPCRYVRISCLRGNPIAIFFIQLIGISVPGLEPEFQPVVDHLLPHILLHKLDAHDMYLKFLQDMTRRLHTFLPQLEADLSSFQDDVDFNLHFLAMLTGPFFPILQFLSEREIARTSSTIVVTVSSNFEPRRSCGPSSVTFSASSSAAFWPDAIFLLLRKALKDPHLEIVCRMGSKILEKLNESTCQEESSDAGGTSKLDEQTSKSEPFSNKDQTDYSSLFGEKNSLLASEFNCCIININILDTSAVEEGILHILFSCAAQPALCHRLSENPSNLCFALPLVQALLPALRPYGSSSCDHISDFSLWGQASVQQALSQIVLMSSSPSYHPLLEACAGYLSSFSQSHAKAACLLIDLCSSVLASWTAQVIAKVDLSIELLEDLLGTLQGASQSMASVHAAIKYIVLALSGHMDNILGKYKEVKHKILFLLEMLEPFLVPAMCPVKGGTIFGDTTFTKKEEENCAIALDIIRIAVEKPAVLPSLETEWQHGSVSPSVLLSILDPQLDLPTGIDLCKPARKSIEFDPSSTSKVPCQVGLKKAPKQVDTDISADVSDSTIKVDVYDDVRLYFAPQELRSLSLTNTNLSCNKAVRDVMAEKKDDDEKFTLLSPSGLVLDSDLGTKFFNLQADSFQLENIQDCEIKASEFKRLAHELQTHDSISSEGHDAAVDALLSAAECYVNPFFLKSVGEGSNFVKEFEITKARNQKDLKPRSGAEKKHVSIETIAKLERQRDVIVFQILLEAAELDRKFKLELSTKEMYSSAEVCDEHVIDLSPSDMIYLDAITLVRQNQALICNFLVQRLMKDQHSHHETLMHCLVFLLRSATKLFCPPEDVIHIILQSADYLSVMLTSIHHHLREENYRLRPEKGVVIQRRWLLLQKLVIASSGNAGDFDSTEKVEDCFMRQSFIPSISWVQKITPLSHSSSAVVRFVGWMAVSRIAKQFISDRIYLVSDLSELTGLLSIFADELAVVHKYIDPETGNMNTEFARQKESAGEASEHSDFHVIYPYLGMFFPQMKKQFQVFGEFILEAVSLQLRLLSSAALPDILCWFSDMCTWPFSDKGEVGKMNSDFFKGYVGRNTKAVILYILESIVKAHMEAMVLEIPRVVQVLVSLCKASYCDVAFLNSILLVLRPIITHALQKASSVEKVTADETCLDFETLCFEELFKCIRQRDENQYTCMGKTSTMSRTIFVLASVLPDLTFQSKRAFLQSLMQWTHFPDFEPTSSFHDYLCAFQAVLDSCKLFLMQILQAFGCLPIQFPGISGPQTVCNKNPLKRPLFLKEIILNSSNVSGSQYISKDDAFLSTQNVKLLSSEVEGFTKDLEDLIVCLQVTIEKCWSLHCQLSKKLTNISAECFVYLRCLASASAISQNCEEDNNENLDSDRCLGHCKKSLEGLAERILILQDNHCWEVSSTILDCLLGSPPCFQLDNVTNYICSAIRKNVSSAPRLLLRVQSDEWLSLLFERVGHGLCESDVSPLADLFCAMLDHAEPEQRLIGLRHLCKLLGKDMDDEVAVKSSILCHKPLGIVSSVPQPTLSLLVGSTWDSVVFRASSDTSISIRTCAMALLVDFIPYASRKLLQKFLCASDSVLHCFGKAGGSLGEGPLLRLSLAIIASCCLYCSSEDLALIHQSVWTSIEILGSSRIDGRLELVETKACQLLCRFRNGEDEAREVLREVVSSSFEVEDNLDFRSTRQSILEVLSSLSSVESYFELLAKKVDEETIELEEAEIELDIVKKEHNVPDILGSKENHQLPHVTSSRKHDNRLQQIKDDIYALEKAKLREDLVARRQKKILMWRDRQKYLEETALREAELLQELDRERAAEAEKEIERQLALELERAKTRDLRHQLEMEKEMQMQRELQRELEQAESGLRSSRRDSSASHSGRPRERFRERDNGRSGSEGSTRGQETVNTPTMVLSGSRSFSGQPPTILQSRDRLEEYDETLEGSRDSGDTGSVGELEMGSGFEGQSGQRLSGSRGGSKSRQVMERRERSESSRREGKWERKH
ncbi:uncharacterized protein LOC9306524 isoform X1 [Arabidopsis lyrata subsp. lyrata]|uniref:uncharacterized protein LOC9306524 isoform X1 n=2 Tax=Arabidopsis lyrata subsp. lyrata TaxID=81972 RepID=UPI000A29D6C6|nr:uncharacterized protein LOC9306524 isoform X1 [Arabidopsis lyrata subsp. lyrata]|eukprot:XP_020872334.1 uncharacterized protein LOC9306524 isoform X1 [Arabidopsis lyrata subsp. lyrata]